MAHRAGTPNGHSVWRQPGRYARATALVAALHILGSAVAEGAPLYLVPRLDAIAGTTSNRFRAPEAEGSAFLRVTPALEAVWFGPADWEAGAAVTHLTTRFARAGFKRQDETSARAYLWRSLPAAELSAAAQVGVYRDRAIPDDDATWMRGEVAVRWQPAHRFTPALTALLTQTDFDTRTTPDGGARSDLHWSLEPEFAWQVGSGQTLWGGAAVEGATSDAAADNYLGFRLTAGVDTRLRETIGAGLWAQWHMRRYDDRTDTPLGAGTWGNLRLSPWAELTAAARYLDHHSTNALDEYREWVVEAGLRLRYDWPLVH